MNSNRELFETMPVRKALTKMAIPTIISQLITMIYNLADTFFIGQTNNSYMVAAVSVSYMLFYILTALSNLLGIGGGSLISRMLGEHRDEECRNVCSFSLYTSALVGVLYSLGVLVFMEPILNLIGTSENTIAFCRQYLFWVVVVGGLPTMLSLTMSHLLRNIGHAKKSSFGIGMGGILNIIPDPIFMFLILKPGNEVIGAAVATMLSNVISFIYFAVVFFRLKDSTILCYSIKKLKPHKGAIPAIFLVGLPAMLGPLLAAISNIVVNNLMVSYNDFAIAAMGIVKKVDMIPLSISQGVAQAMLPLVAYNYASKDYKRMNDFTKASQFCVMGFAFACVIVFEMFALYIITPFIKDPQTVEYGVRFLRIAVIGTPFMGYNILTTFNFQAVGKGAESIVISSCRQGVISIPFMFLMNRIAGLFGLAWTQTLADILTFIIAFVLYRRFYKRLRSSQL